MIQILSALQRPRQSESSLCSAETHLLCRRSPLLRTHADRNGNLEGSRLGHGRLSGFYHLYSPELYEAATIDGAGRFQKMLHITLPALRPVVSIMFILNSGNLINAGFDQIYNLYNPAVYKVADIIDTYVYRRGLLDMKYSFSSAAGLFKNVISFALVLTTNGLVKVISGKENGIW